MNKQFCSSCGQRNSENSRNCPSCGNNLEEVQPNSLINQPTMAMNQPGGQIVSAGSENEMFSSVLEEPQSSSASSASSAIGKTIMAACCVLSIFFGGLIALGVSFLIYLPFRNRSSGWIFFVVPYLFTTFVLLVIFSR